MTPDYSTSEAAGRSGLGRARRVGVNLLWLVPGVVGGSEEHTIRMLHALAKRRDEVDLSDLDVTLFANRSLREAHGELFDLFDVQVAPTTGASRGARVGVESTWLAWRARVAGIDVMHHAGGTVPVLRGCPAVVTIHDLQPLTMPDNFSPLKRRYLGLTIPSSVRRARRVVTLTRWVADDVVARLGTPRSKMALVPPVVLPPSDYAGEVDAAVLGRYDLAGRDFFVYPAITYAHKNHLMLLDAFAAVLGDHPEAVLALTGGEGPVEAEVMAKVEGLGIDHAVRRTGRIPRGDLDTLYRCAVALTFASSYEGCGMPVLEAMAEGCPVIASDVTALPEVVGDAGILVGHDARGRWAQEMSALLVDDRQRARMGDAGLQRVKAFSSSAAADALISLYRSDTDGTNPGGSNPGGSGSGA